MQDNNNTNNTDEVLADILRRRAADQKRNEQPSVSQQQPSASQQPISSQNTSASQQPISSQNTSASQQPPAQRQPQQTQKKPAVVSFDDIDPENARIRRNRQLKNRLNRGKGTAAALVKTVFYLIFVIIASVLLANLIINVANDIYAFEKQDVNVVLNIPQGADIGEVAELLKQNGVIKYPFVFKLYASREIKESRYYDGTFKTEPVKIVFKNSKEESDDTQTNYTEYLQLSKEENEANKILNYDRIISLVAFSTYKPRETVRITIPEGYTVEEIISLLVSNGVGERADYIEAINNYDYNYKFVKDISKDVERKYRLEGYLFPDTYDFFTDESEISVINKLLSNFEIKFEDMYYERAAELGMSVDELITLASILQKEARFAQDYPLMSSVFHRRLDGNYRLESDATILYVINDYETNEQALESPYNSYKTVGMIPGPISNPGIEAISAAFYPEKTNYNYFFSLKNGETVYSRTYQEHTSKLAKAKAEGKYAS